MTETPDDPRLRPDYRRTVGAGEDRVVLVGVVHDHPASVHRARTVVEEVAPDAVAVELPALALSSFVDGDPAGPGGEMAAAAAAGRAAGVDRVVGIDAPSGRYLAALAAVVAERRPPAGTLLDVVTETLSVTAHAVRCRLAAAVPGAAPPVERVDHDVDATAPPAAQADHEATHLARSRSLLGLDRPPAMTVTDDARERAMARRLRSLREDGSVVAVVGFDHLDAVTRHLRGSGARR